MLNGAAGVFEVDVDAVRRQLCQFRVQVIGFVVDRAVKAQFVDQPAAFFIVSRHADDLEAFGPGQLADDGAYRAGGAADHNGLTCLGVTDMKESLGGGQAGQGEHRQDGFRVEAGLEFIEALAAAQVVFGPAHHAHDPVADRKVRVVALDHLAQAGRAHHGAELDRWDIAVGVRAHPAEHGGVQGHMGLLYQDLAGARLRYIRLHDLEYFGTDRAGGGAGYQLDCGVGAHSRCFLLPIGMSEVPDTFRRLRQCVRSIISS